MKKIKRLVIYAILSLILFWTTNCYALTLDTINITVNKTTIKPGSEIKLNVNFGTQLEAYTFDIAYDNKIFEFVSVDGGIADDVQDKVTVKFQDKDNLRENMSIIFKAKDDITTSNPTEFTVVGKDLTGKDGNIIYDDITTPMVKNVLVEPEYVKYLLNFTHEGEIIKDEEKDVKLSILSTMGEYYEHARLIVEATKPEGAIVKLTGINEEENVEQDLIKSGWGDPQGYEIGGKNYSQVLNLKALFNKEGEYTLTFKLIDRDDSDEVIAEKEYKIKVLAEATKAPLPAQNEVANSVVQVPKTLPKTGFNYYVPIIIVMVIITLGIIYYNKKSKK